jgi:hypothetical protein
VRQPPGPARSQMRRAARRATYVIEQVDPISARPQIRCVQPVKLPEQRGGDGLRRLSPRRRWLTGGTSASRATQALADPLHPVDIGEPDVPI